MNNIAEKNGIKIAATAIIWAFGTGMMAICIPLVNISRSGIILPLAVILGASTGTATIWRSGNQNSIKLFGDLQQIERRIRDLETICINEELKLKK